MLDVDFLLSPKPTMRNNVLFASDTLALWPQVLTKLRTIFTAKKLTPASLLPASAISTLTTPSFFSTNVCIANLDEWFETDKALATKTLENLANLVANKPTLLEHHFCFYGSVKHQESDWWQNLTRGATELEEVSLGKGTANRILPYLTSLNPKIGRLDKTGIDTLMGIINDMGNDTDENLPNLLNQLDLITTICIVDELNSSPTPGKEIQVTSTKKSRSRGETDPDKVLFFSQPLYDTFFNKDNGLAYDHWHRLLFNFLTHRDGTRADQLYGAIDLAVHQQLLEPAQIYGTILRVTDEFFYCNTQLGGLKPENFTDFRWSKLQQFSTLPATTLLMWNNYLLHFQPTLLTKSHTNWLSLFYRMVNLKGVS